MTVFEWGMAVALAAGGVRSLWIWGRRDLEANDVADLLLYALFVTGRVGLWFAFAGLFAIYAMNDAEGRAFVDELNEFRWYLVVLVGLSALQFVAGQLLGRRAPDGRDAEPPTSGAP